MRTAIALLHLCRRRFFGAGPASAVPLALGDQAALSRDVSGGVAGAGGRAAMRAPSATAAKYPRRYNWCYYPYWRPYQYRYWQFYYPMAGRCSKRGTN